MTCVRGFGMNRRELGLGLGAGHKRSKNKKGNVLCRPRILVQG